MLKIETLKLEGIWNSETLRTIYWSRHAVPVGQKQATYGAGF